MGSELPLGHGEVLELINGQADAKFGKVVAGSFQYLAWYLLVVSFLTFSFI